MVNMECVWMAVIVSRIIFTFCEIWEITCQWKLLVLCKLCKCNGNEVPMHTVLMVLDLGVKSEPDMFLMGFVKITQAHLKPDLTSKTRHGWLVKSKPATCQTFTRVFLKASVISINIIIVSYLIKSHIKAVLTKALVANANDCRGREQE